VREPHAGREQVKRGGYRGTSKRARYTAQLVALEEPAVAARVRALESDGEFGRSMGTVMRDIVRAGLPIIEARYREANEGDTPGAMPIGDDELTKEPSA